MGTGTQNPPTEAQTVERLDDLRSTLVLLREKLDKVDSDSLEEVMVRLQQDIYVWEYYHTRRNETQASYRRGKYDRE